MSLHRGDIPCPAGCGGRIRVEVLEDDPWGGAYEQAVLDQDGCECDPEELEEAYDFSRHLDDHADPHAEPDYTDFDPYDVDPERGIPF